MKKILLLLTALVIIGSCKQQTQQTIELPSDLKGISVLLDSVHVEDQKYRGEAGALLKKYGWEAKETQEHWKKMRETDASNLIIIEAVLAKHGWLSTEEVGSTANSTLFLVIQHANQKTQEKYLPMLRQAVKDGKAASEDLALMEDRVSLGKGELQVYGSQLGADRETGEMYVLPMIEPEKVNERRAEVGLGTIEDNVARWDLKWDVEAYKKNLPKRIKELKSGRN